MPSLRSFRERANAILAQLVMHSRDPRMGRRCVCVWHQSGRTRTNHATQLPRLRSWQSGFGSHVKCGQTVNGMTVHPNC